MNTPPTHAIDFESYYDSKISIKTLGAWHYLRHPKTNIYLVSIVGGGITYVGRPEEAPWTSLDGSRWVAHNYAFDGAVVEALREKGVIPPQIQPADWNCTANLSVFNSGGRSLQDASRNLLNSDISKDLRKWMRGKSLDEAVAAGKKEELFDYALRDAQASLALWDRYNDKWPELEQWLSKHTIEMGWRGVHTDSELLNSAIDKLHKIKGAAQNQLPWFDEEETINSLHKLYQACRNIGIEPPASTAEDDPRCVEWEKAHEDIPWVKAMREWRKANFLLTKLRKIRDRKRPDGTVPFGLKYGGAHTLRWSGEGGFNLQNQNRDPIFGIDARRIFIPTPGKKFAIVDLSQIEPRVLAWLTKDWEFLELVKTMSPYEAHARLYMGWEGDKLKADKKKYALAKARVLALGYGAGWEKFIFMCRTYGIEPEEVFSDPVGEQEVEAFVEALNRNRKHLDKVNTFEALPKDKQRIWVNAWNQVMDFRTTNYRIVNFWSLLHSLLIKAAAHEDDGNLELGLPSGRGLHYFNIATTSNELLARTQINGDSEHFYGGKLCENMVQAIARDVFAEGMRRVETAGYPVRFHVHDEIVAEVDPETHVSILEHLMSITPSWLKRCPVAAEGHITDHYEKD